MTPTPVDVLVIGAGQAGLSAAHHLIRRGLRPVGAAAPGEAGSFVVLDENRAPGGAWQHRWESLRMGTVNGIHELPGSPVPPAPDSVAARDALPAYFADYERRFDLRVRRPVTVLSVTRADDDPHGRLIVTTDVGRWAARYVINATGTWTRPNLPFVPGWDTFLGRQLHTAHYVSKDAFVGHRVVIVGAGVSALQLLDEISDVADTFWVSRTEPHFQRDAWTDRMRIEALDAVEERIRDGHPSGSIVSVTGQHYSPWVRDAEAKGVLEWHPMFTAIEPDGVRMPDGSFEPADVILWATGFRPAIGHLDPLGLRTEHGGVRVARGHAPR